MTTSDNFDWCSDPAVILHEQPPIAVYTNESGAIILRMGGDVIQNYDQIIIIRPENALAIVGAILRAADMGDVELSRKLFDMPYGAGYEDVELPPALTGGDDNSGSLPREPKDPTAAERMRRYRNKHRNDDRNDDRNGVTGRSGAGQNGVREELPLGDQGVAS